MGEINEETPNQHETDGAPEDKWYFVDESIKQRLGGGDGPSFSVASLFSSHAETFSKPEEPSGDTPVIHGSSSIWKKDSLFILDPDDSRISIVGRFFDNVPTNLSTNDQIKRRREIRLIVQNKFKRTERNQDKFKTGLSRFTNPRYKYKKQKTQ